jgi:hypothetical protein
VSESVLVEQQTVVIDLGEAVNGTAGTLSFLDKIDRVKKQGFYIHIYKKEGKIWQIVEQILHKLLLEHCLHMK